MKERRVDAICRDDRYRFMLPEDCGDVVLRSRADRPRDSSSANDWRRLGLRLHRIALCGPDGARELALDDAMLCDGFHGVETDEGGWVARWTDGAARLPITTLAKDRRVTAIEIGIDRGLLFWVPPVEPCEATDPALRHAA